MEIIRQPKYPNIILISYVVENSFFRDLFLSDTFWTFTARELVFIGQLHPVPPILHEPDLNISRPPVVAAMPKTPLTAEEISPEPTLTMARLSIATRN